MVSYPLDQVGDYFPMWAPSATGFEVGDAPPAGRLRAMLEGLAVVESLAVDRLVSLGQRRPTRLTTIGGATRSSLLLHIRASMLDIPVVPVDSVDTSVGAAILAMGAAGVPLQSAVASATRMGTVVEPDPDLRAAYVDLKERYLVEFRRRGYLDDAGAVAPAGGN